MPTKVLPGLVICALAMGSPAIAAASLPGDATSLNEAHGNWWVRCGFQGKGDASVVACTVVQQQLQKSTNQRVLTLALSMGPDGSAKGTLVMPFGLDIQKGVQLQLDDGSETPPLLFHTCLPAGCLVTLDWQKSTIEAMGNAKVMHISALADNGQPAKFDVSLNGFGPAAQRAQELTAP